MGRSEMERKVLFFVKGYVYSILLTLAFFAVGWISPGAETDKLVALFVTAFVLWSVTFLFSSLFLFVFTISLEASWLGVIIASALIGWFMVSIIKYILPEGWIVFGEDTDLVVGFFYLALYVYLRKDVWEEVIRESDIDDEDDEEEISEKGSKRKRS